MIEKQKLNLQGRVEIRKKGHGHEEPDRKIIPEQRNTFCLGKAEDRQAARVRGQRWTEVSHSVEGVDTCWLQFCSIGVIWQDEEAWAIGGNH